MAPDGGTTIIVQESGRILELSVTDPIIDYMHFHFVAKKRSLESLPKGGVIDISAAVQKAYAKYIIRVTKKPLSDRCYDIYHVDTDYSLEVRKKNRNNAQESSSPRCQEAGDKC